MHSFPKYHTCKEWRTTYRVSQINIRTRHKWKGTTPKITIMIKCKKSFLLNENSIDSQSRCHFSNNVQKMENKSLLHRCTRAGLWRSKFFKKIRQKKWLDSLLTWWLITNARLTQHWYKWHKLYVTSALLYHFFFHPVSSGSFTHLWHRCELNSCGC